MPESVVPAGSRERIWSMVFAALVLIDLLWIAPRLLVADLNLDYPFVDGDSWDWIANGLALVGHPVPSSGRPPLVPLVLAGLERLGAMRLYPLLAQLLVHGTALGFYRLAARRYGPGIAFATGAALLFNHSYQGLSFDLMADVPASCLLFAAAAAFLAASDRPAAYAAAGLLGALAGLTQQAALLLPVAAAAAVLVHRRPHLRSPWLWAGALLFAAPPLGWAAWRRLAFAGSDAVVRHWGLLRLHDGGEYSLWALASLLGLPGLLLLVAGLGRAWVRALRRGSLAVKSFAPVSETGAKAFAPGGDRAGQLFLAALLTALLLFFAFAYDFQAKRFLAYGWWIGGLLIAGALAALRRPALRRTAAALLVAGSVLPLPAPGHDPTWVALWPLPPRHARVELTPAARGSADLEIASAAVVRLPAAELARAWNLRRVVEARSSVPAPRLDPALLAADRGALFLYGPGEAGARYRTITRLGNALHRPLKFVPAGWLGPYRNLIAAEPLGRLAETTVFRAGVRGLSGTWLLLATAGGPAEAHLAAPAAPAPVDRPLRRRIERGRRAAREVAAWVADSDGYVALLPGPERDLARLYLPFFLDTTELRLIEPAEESAARAFLAGVPVREERRIGGLVASKAEILGRRAAIVRPIE